MDNIISKPKFNTFENVPQVPYKILDYLIEHNQTIFKLLKYNTRDALSKPSLTKDEIYDMLYVDAELEDNYNIFLKPLVGDEISESCTQLRFYKAQMIPTDNLHCIVCYEFDVLCGSKIGLVDDENEVPVSRIDLMEAELLNTLNGLDTFGIGYFQFNRQFTRSCMENLAISNNKTFYGGSLILCVNMMALDGDYCE